MISEMILDALARKTNQPTTIAPDVFGDKDTIYLPINITNKDIEKLTRVKAIRNHVSTKIEEISEFDYLRGKVVSKKQTYKIGKLIKDDRKLLSEFQKDPIRNSDDLTIAISKRPIDIIKMSTNRPWSSCMSLSLQALQGKPGAHELTSVDRVLEHVNNGAFIAYLVRKKDIEIVDPLSRVMIKPYRSANGDVTYYVSKVYGIPNSFFRKEVRKYIKKKIPKIEKNSLYFPQVYRDKGDPETISVKNIVIRNKNNARITYYLNGKLHRENGPAVIFVDSDGRRCKEYWQHGKYHREDGPAIVYGRRYKEWLIEGKYHRENGPAIIMGEGEPDELREYWVNGEEVLDEKFQALLDTMKIVKLT